MPEIMDEDWMKGNDEVTAQLYMAAIAYVLAKGGHIRAIETVGAIVTPEAPGLFVLGLKCHGVAPEYGRKV